MSIETVYKTIPSEIVEEFYAVRNPKANLDPKLCGYQILIDKYKIPTTGIIHVGGHVGQELPLYAALGFRNVVMIEPLKEEFDILNERVNKYNKVYKQFTHFFGGDDPLMKAHALNYAITEEPGMATFYRTEVSSLSSLAKPINSGFSVEDSILYEEVNVSCKTLDEVIDELPNNWTAADFNYLRINVQGSEMKVLQGARSFLNSVSYVDLETNIIPRYEGNPTTSDFDEFLSQYGFYPLLGYVIGVVGNVIYARK